MAVSVSRQPLDGVRYRGVIRCVHGQVFDSPALSDPHCPPELKAAWQSLQQTLNEAADKITFQQLLEEGAHKGKMSYIQT